MEEKKIGVLSVISLVAGVFGLILSFITAIGLPFLVVFLFIIAAIVLGIVALIKKEKIAMPIIGMSLAGVAIFIGLVCSITRGVVKTAGGIASTSLDRFNSLYGNYDDYYNYNYNSLYNNTSNYNILSNGTYTNYSAFNTTTNSLNTTNTTNATNTTTVPSSDRQKIGSATDGYLTIPNDWNKFYDVDAPGSIQYTYKYLYIVTLKGIGETTQTVDSLADSMKAQISTENTTNISVSDASIGGYSAKKLRAFYPSENTWLDIYFVKANNKMYYISIEGPDSNSDYFKQIPDTFSLY